MNFIKKVMFGSAVATLLVWGVEASPLNEENLADLPTEQANEKFQTLETMPIEEITSQLGDEMIVAAQAVKEASSEIARAVTGVLPSLEEEGSRLVYSGAGTSGRLGTLDGAELFPTFGFPDDRIVTLMAGGDEALKRSILGAEDDVKQAMNDFNKHHFTEKDVFILIAASGRTPYPLKVMEMAHEIGAQTVGISSVKNSPLLQGVRYPIFTNTGPEAIAGSTRMKAGTAQTGVLKNFSTTLMSKLGLVYKGRMACLQVRCKKLENRVVKITQFYTGIEDFNEAKAYLDSAGGDNRVVVLMYEYGMTRDKAESLLRQAGGNVLKAKKDYENTLSECAF